MNELDEAIAKLIRLFPSSPFCLQYIERGPHKNRAFGWHIEFTTNSFTSDSDRLVDNHGRPNFESGWGATPAEAVNALIKAMLSMTANRAKAAAEHAKDEQRVLEGLLERAEVKP